MKFLKIYAKSCSFVKKKKKMKNVTVSRNANVSNSSRLELFVVEILFGEGALLSDIRHRHRHR